VPGPEGIPHGASALAEEETEQMVNLKYGIKGWGRQGRGDTESGKGVPLTQVVRKVSEEDI
jgi:hypothetical protein